MSSDSAIKKPECAQAVGVVASVAEMVRNAGPNLSPDQVNYLIQRLRNLTSAANVLQGDEAPIPAKVKEAPIPAKVEEAAIPAKVEEAAIPAKVEEAAKPPPDQGAQPVPAPEQGDMPTVQEKPPPVQTEALSLVDQPLEGNMGGPLN